MHNEVIENSKDWNLKIFINESINNNLDDLQKENKCKFIHLSTKIANNYIKILITYTNFQTKKRKFIPLKEISLLNFLYNNIKNENDYKMKLIK